MYIAKEWSLTVTCAQNNITNKKGHEHVRKRSIKCKVSFLYKSQDEWFTAILHIRLIIQNLKLEINTCNYLMGVSLFYHFIWIRTKPSDILMQQTEKPSSPPSLQ
jgi:hypothetical protein